MFDYLVSSVGDAHPLRLGRTSSALGILSAMVLVVAFGLLSILKAALLAACLMLLTRCCTPAKARRSVDWQVLIVIAAAFGFGQALEQIGVAHAAALGLTSFAGSDPRANLMMIYGATSMFSSVITNNAAAVLMFPVAGVVAAGLGVSLLPFAVAVALAASTSFTTPIGYQTNLMVYGPGGYRFGDYIRLGTPLKMLCAALAVLIIPLVWPRHLSEKNLMTDLSAIASPTTVADPRQKTHSIRTPP